MKQASLTWRRLGTVKVFNIILRQIFNCVGREALYQEKTDKCSQQTAYKLLDNRNKKERVDINKTTRRSLLRRQSPVGGNKLFNKEVKQQSRKAACETEIIYRYT